MDLYRDLAARFLERESSRVGLITVTHAEVRGEGEEVRVYLSIYPREKQKEALGFARRKLHDLRAFVMQETRMKSVPRFSFAPDLGEQNRQRIEELLSSSD